MDYYAIRKRKKKLLSVIKARETEKRFMMLKLPPPDDVLSILNEYRGIPSSVIHDEINDLSRRMNEIKNNKEV